MEQTYTVATSVAFVEGRQAWRASWQVSTPGRVGVSAARWCDSEEAGRAWIAREVADEIADCLRPKPART